MPALIWSPGFFTSTWGEGQDPSPCPGRIGAPAPEARLVAPGTPRGRSRVQGLAVCDGLTVQQALCLV